MKTLKTLTLVFTLSIIVACSNDDAPTETPVVYNLETDRKALIEIYNANINNTLTWDIAATDVSTWDGITVENNRVAVLSIGNKNMETLPASALQKLTALRNLVANSNGLESIDVSGNVNLKNLQLFNNQLESIDITHNVLLEQLLVENNNLEHLDVSMLTNLTDLKAGSNNFTDMVNIANGNNSNMWRMNIGPNINLSCIQVDLGATNGFNGWSKPMNASYSTNCP